MSFAQSELEETLVSIIKEKVEGRKVGIACSGGLDSGLVSAISKRYAESVTLYTCGTPNSYDVCMAKDLGEKLKIPWVHVPISKGNLESLIMELISATGESDPFTISYELQLFCVCRESKEEIILTGQGADEYLMGCAKFVGCSDYDYDILTKAAVERLLNVSVPCEQRIADHYEKELIYPYLDPRMTEVIGHIDPALLKPKDMDSRKAVLRDVAIHLGYPCVAERKKKSSQYGSGTTDLVRALAKEKGMMYNRYIASIYDNVIDGLPSSGRGAIINARIDSVIKERAEKILREEGMTPSEAIERFYLKVIEDGGSDAIRRK